MTLHRRAADWYEASGSPALALEHLLHTTDWDRSVRLAAALAQPTYNAGQMSTVQRWYRAIGDANIERYPPLAVLRCWEGRADWRHGRGASGGRRSWTLPRSTGVPADGSASFDSARAMLRAVMCASGPEPMMADAAFAVGLGARLEPMARPRRCGCSVKRTCSPDSPTRPAPFSRKHPPLRPRRATSDAIVICESELAMLAMDRGQWLRGGRPAGARAGHDR